MKKAVVVIHGGNFHPSHEAFVKDLKKVEIDIDRMRLSHRWKDTFQEDLGDEFEVFLPRMPLSDNADYALWKLWFEKTMDALNRPCILVGHSLGAMFLLKYLSEQKPKNVVTAVFLIAPEYVGPKSAAQEKTSFDVGEDISKITEVTDKIIFLHSTDDPVVSFDNQAIFKKLLPQAEYVELDKKGHCNTEDFPELLERIKML